MKKFILIAAAFATMLTSCWQEPEYAADYERHIISDLTAQPGDECVTLSWKMAEGFTPVEYLISYNDTEGETVRLRTGSNACEYVVEDLVNGGIYVFSVQAVYKDDALSGIVKVTATPVTERYPVTDLTLTPGDRKIDVSWKLPAAENFTGLTLTLTPADGTAPTVKELGKTVVSHSFTSLVNFKEYGVSLVVNYPKGPSEPASANATPMSGAPLCTVLYDSVFYGQEDTFTFNTTDYPGASDITWTFEDGTVLTGEVVKHKVWGIGEVAETVSAKINGIDVSYKIYLNAREYMLSYNTWSNANVKFKNNNFVFSPDRKSAYTITYNQNRILVAMDIEKGSVKWTRDLGSGPAGNGAWISVNPVTGDVLVSDSSNLYSIKDGGTSSSVTWSSATGLTVGVGAAFSPDASVIYCGASTKFITLNAATGAKLGEVASGKVSAIVVDNNTVLVTTQTTSDNVIFYNVTDPKNISEIKKLTASGPGMDITSASVAPDKKTVYFSSKEYFHCIDLSTKSMVKSIRLGDNAGGALTDGSIVDKDGNVYVEYAATSATSFISYFSARLETKKWDWISPLDPQHKNFFNYSSPTLDVDGNIINNDYKGNVWSIGPDGKGTVIFKGGNSVQGSAGFCGNVVLCSYNIAPGLILAKCVKAERAGGWSGPGGDPCCTKCIQWAFK